MCLGAVFLIIPLTQAVNRLCIFSEMPRRSARGTTTWWLFATAVTCLFLALSALSFSKSSSPKQIDSPISVVKPVGSAARLTRREGPDNDVHSAHASTSPQATIARAPESGCTGDCAGNRSVSASAAVRQHDAPAPSVPTDSPSPAPASHTPAPLSASPRAFTAPATADDVSLHGIIMAAPGLSETDLTRTLVSVSRLPQQQTLLVLMVEKAQAEWISAKVKAATAAMSAALLPGMPYLRIRLYDVDVLRSAIPGEQSSLAPAIHRYFLYPLLLEDLRALQEGTTPVAGSHAATVRAAVLYSNIESSVAPSGGLVSNSSLRNGTSQSAGRQATRLFPDAWLISDARDVLFQRDPFAEFWANAEQAWHHAVKQASGTIREPGPERAAEAEGGATGVVGWQNTRTLPLVLAAAEADVMKLGQEDWNRGWVSMCYYDLGESMVNEGNIYCSGTTFGTTAGLLMYLQQGMYPAMDLCMGLRDDKGVDQGIHNVLLHLHMYTPDKLRYWRQRADVGGPFRPGGGKDPVMTHPHKLLDLVERLQKQLLVRESRAEDGMICTMALLLRLEGGSDTDGEGQLLSLTAPRHPCAIVHQFDRSPHLYDMWTQTYVWPQGP